MRALIYLAVIVFGDVFTLLAGGDELVNQANPYRRPGTYALIIGVSNYKEKEIPTLHYAHVDAMAFRDYLIANNVDSGNIIMLTNEQALSATINYYFYNLCVHSIKGDKIYFYFSGHGDVESKLVDAPGYLLAYDATRMVYASTAMEMGNIQRYVSTASTNGAEIYCIVDACHSGTLAGGPEGQRSLQEHLKGTWKDEIKILSCEAGQSSSEGPQWGHGRGVFSYVLINGLSGDADRDHDSIITLNELDLYLKTVVPEEAKPHIQYPVVIGKHGAEVATANWKYLSILKNTYGQHDSTTLAAKAIAKNASPLPDDSSTYYYNQFRTFLRDGPLVASNRQQTAYTHYENFFRKNPSSAVIPGMKKWDPLESTCRHASLSIL